MLHRSPWLSVIGFVLAVAIGCGCAVAADFTAVAEQAKASFAPIDAAGVEAARAELASASAALERRLDPASGIGRGWLEYLSWSGVQQQLAPGADASLPAARRTLAAIGSGAEGLEATEFQRLAEALRRYIGVVRFSGVKDQGAVFARQVDAVSGLLAGDTPLDSAVGFEVERRLALLQNAGLGDEFVGAVIGEFDSPNVLLEAEESLLSRIADRMVSECGPVEDCILGTTIRGTGFTSGLLTVSAMPADDRARLAFSLSGTTRSSTRGVNGPVAIYSTGNTSFTAHKIVELSDQSFRLLPTSASATTRTRTNGVRAINGGLFSGLIETIAADRVAEKKPRADAIAADHAEDRIAKQLDDRLLETIHDARRRYDDRLTKPLRRRLASPRRIEQSTTDDTLRIHAVQAGPSQLAASGEAPAAGGGELTARIHQSAANNLLAAYLGGATLVRESQDDEASLVGRVTPEWLTPDADEPTRAPREDVEFKPYRLRFRAGRPVSIALSDGALRATVHVDRLTVEGDRYEDWDLILTFKPEVADGRWKLVRQGEIEVLPTGFDPAGGERLASKQVALRGNLAKALNDPADRLPQEIRIDPIDLDPDASIDLLGIEHLDFADGWAVVGWRSE